MIVIFCIMAIVFIYFYTHRLKITKPTRVMTASGHLLVLKPIETLDDFVRYNPELTKYAPTECVPAPSSFNVIDFETANMYPDSICQMGITVVKDNQIVETKSFFIRPPYDDFTNTKIHGITLNQVKFSPTFGELWPSIKPYIEDQIIAAYNLKFDTGCLAAVLDYFNIPIPDYTAFDILTSARYYYRGLKNYKQVTVANYLQIPVEKAHDGQDDSRVAAAIQIAINTTIADPTDIVYLRIQNNQKRRDLMAKLTKGYSIWQECFSDGAKLWTLDERIKKIEFAISLGCQGAFVYKEYGECLEMQGNLSDALNAYKKALSLNEKVGVKLKIKSLQKKISGDKK